MRANLALPMLASAAAALANDNPFGYSNDTGITQKGEHELQQSVTMRSGLEQGAGFDGGYLGFDFTTQFETGLSDVEHLDVQVNEASLRSASFRGFRFVGLGLEYKHLIRNDAQGGWGAAWGAGLGYSQLDGANGALRTETSCSASLMLQRSFGARGRWYYVTNLSAGLAHADATTGGIEWSQGLAYRADDHWAFGFETVADGAWTDFRRFDNSSLRVGPAIAYEAGEFSVSLTALCQVSGAPATDGSRDLRDTCRSEARMLLSFGF